MVGPHSQRELLDAVLALGSDLDPPNILRRIVEAAVGLVDARYGALGVLDDSGTRLDQFITVGIDSQTHDRIATCLRDSASSGCSSSMLSRFGW